MSINVTIDGTKYSGVDQVDVGGKSLHLESDVVAPSGSVNITENGTHDVSNYAKAVVNVASSGESADNYEEFVRLLTGYRTTLDEDLYFTVPDGVTKLRNYAFSQMYPDSVTGMVYLTLPDSVEEIGGHVFEYNRKICIGSLPPNLKVLDGQSFAYAANIFGDSTELEIPASVETIHGLAFYLYNGPAKTMTFKGTPTSIATNGLQGNFTTINVPWAEGEVANAPWGATNATINYNYTGA